MSGQEMIDAAIAANETGEWNAWLAWMHARGVRHVGGLESVPIITPGTTRFSMDGGGTYTTNAVAFTRIARSIAP